MTTRAGKQFLNRLARKNGKSLDGTPIIASTSDIDDLLSKGYITLTTRPETDPLRYAICPVIEDPTDGGIALDQFLALPLKTDGTPVEPAFFENFESLPLTGRLGQLREQIRKYPNETKSKPLRSYPKRLSCL